MSKQPIPIALSADNNYAPYLAVCIQSVISNTAKNRSYQIFILDGGISERNKKLISSLAKENVSISFVDMDEVLSRYPDMSFPLTYHFTKAAYYRLFLSTLFPGLNKLIYIDCDTIIQKDLAELFTVDISGCYFAATRDLGIIRTCSVSEEQTHYYLKILNLTDYTNYIQSGVLVCNLQNIRQDNLVQKFIKKLQEIKNPRFVDQCIINAVCEHHIRYIDSRWNYTWHLPFASANYKQQIPEPYLSMYLKAQDEPWIIHFTGQGTKPWLKPELPLAAYFWHYARQTPFYEEILFQNIPGKFNWHLLKLLADRHRILARYYRCKILSKLTWGPKRTYYRQKREMLHEQVRQIHAFLKN